MAGWSDDIASHSLPATLPSTAKTSTRFLSDYQDQEILRNDISSLDTVTHLVEVWKLLIIEHRGLPQTSYLLFVSQFQAVLLFAKVWNNGLLKRGQYNCSNSLPHCASWLLKKLHWIESQTNCEPLIIFLPIWGIHLLALTNIYKCILHSYICRFNNLTLLCLTGA